MKDYYKILEIEHNASSDEIRTAFRKMALKSHPDHNSHPDAHQQFIEINEAYNILSDPELRMAFDLAWKQYTQPEIIHQQFYPRYQTPTQPTSVYKQKWYKAKKQHKFHEYKKTTLRTSAVVSALSLAFVLLLFTDYFLSPIAYTDEQLMVAHKGDKMILIVQEHKFPVSARTSTEFFAQCDYFEILQTPIFKQNKQFNAYTSARAYSFNPYYSIYTVYVFFPVGLLIASLVGLVWPKEQESVVGGAIVSAIMVIFTLFFMFV